jgi:hypothetical protein
MNSISILLQVAVVFFLAGLVDFLWSLNRIVAVTISAFVAVPLIMALVAAAIPTFAPNCPYKSPLALLIYRAIAFLRWALDGMFILLTEARVFKSLALTSLRRWLPSGDRRHRARLSEIMPATWALRDVQNLRPQSSNALGSDEHALAWIHASTFNESVRDHILLECLVELPPERRAQTAVELIAKAVDYRLADMIKSLRLGKVPNLSESKAQLHMKLLVEAYPYSCSCTDPSCKKVSRDDIHALTQGLSLFSPSTFKEYWRFLKYRIVNSLRSQLSANEMQAFARGMHLALSETSVVPVEGSFT